ncbi:MAG: response regulator [Bdellovibrionales bacterium]
MHTLPSLAKVLLIEDNDADIALTRFVFDHYKICNDISVIKDGQEALDYFLTTPPDDFDSCPDLVFIDVNLPGLNADEILKALREAQHCLKIPITIMTGTDLDGGVSRDPCLKEHCFIPKPLSIEKLIHVIQNFESLQLGIVNVPLQEENATKTKVGS